MTNIKDLYSRRSNHSLTSPNDFSQLPVLRSCPILQESLIKVVNHSSFPIPIRHRHHQVSFVRSLEWVERRNGSTPLLIAICSGSFSIPAKVVLTHAHITSSTEIISDGLFTDEEVLNRCTISTVNIH